MALSSLELTRRCSAKGLLSKEATHEVLRIRQRLYKEAMAKEAGPLFGKLRQVAGAISKRTEPFLSSLKKDLGFARAGVPEVLGEGGKVVKSGRPPQEWGQYAAHLGKLMALGAGLQGAGMAATGLMRHSRDKEVRKDIENSYKGMFDEHPQLSTLDPQKVTRHFDVLARYAPSLAADPTVAGAWVKGTVQMGHIDATAVERLGATQALIDRHHEGRALFQPGHFHTGVALARTAMGGGGGDSK